MQARLFRILFDEIGQPVHQCMHQPITDGGFAPPQIGFLRGAFLTAIFFCHFQQSVSAVVAPIKENILHRFFQARLDIFINGQLAGIDDTHIHAFADGMIEES